MHISEGVLSGTVCLASAGAAALITAVTLKRTETEEVPRIAVMTAAFFVASLVHVKIGPTSSHLVLNGLLGIVLGISAFPAILVALLFQAIMFQHGGLTTLGVNLVIMGLPALMARILFKIKFSNSKIEIQVKSFLAGSLSVILSAIIVAFYLVSAGSEFLNSAKIVLAMNIPVAIIEGIATSFIISFLLKVKPEVIKS